MSVVGSLVGVQEGIEAGLVTGGLVVTERNVAGAIAAGLGATALGVFIGHQIGESSLTLVDNYIGDGGIGFIPSIAIGGSVMWHNLRSKNLQQAGNSIASKLPFVAGAAFAAFEGIESGILTSSAQSSLVAAEALTISAAAVTASLFGGISILASRYSPKNALRLARGVALVPAVYLGAKATPELVDDPKVAGVGIALLGTAAVGGAINSFFKRKNPERLTNVS